MTGAGAGAPPAAEREREELAALAGQGPFTRWKGYWRRSGPGWLQSAMTLGGASAMASLFAGAYLQYRLLWVQPAAMALGVVMLAAMAHQTLATGMRPFRAMRTFLHPAVAWAWLAAALITTVTFHFPQYALAAGMTEEMIRAASGWEARGAGRTRLLLGLGALYLAAATAVTWSYTSGRKGVRTYERVLKGMVWLIIAAFAAVVLRRSLDGAIAWGEVGRGFLPLSLPADRRGVAVLMGAFGGAVGVNMTFLFSYTLLARGWRGEHRGLARFDLITGTFLPFVLATSLMVIATGSTIHDPAALAGGGTMLHPARAAAMFEAAGLGVVLSRYVFALGILAMALSTMSMQMLMAGFAVCEALGIEPAGWRHRLACLLPAPAMAGVVLWQSIGPWIGVAAAALSGLLLPVAYGAFFLLHNSRAFLGEARPRGWRRTAWNAAMGLAILASLGSGGYYVASLLG